MTLKREKEKCMRKICEKKNDGHCLFVVYEKSA